jgi:hypothetical protein
MNRAGPFERKESLAKLMNITQLLLGIHQSQSIKIIFAELICFNSQFIV